jgi:hypothetical protein
MTTTSDGSLPPGADPGPDGSGFPDTAPMLMPMPTPVPTPSVPPAPGASELPPPPPLLSHLQPEAQAAAAAAAAGQAPPGGSRRRLPVDTPSSAGRVVLPIALCLVGVVALGAGWIHLEADRAAEAQERLAVVAPSAKPPVPSLGEAAPTTTPTPAVSSSPSASASPSSSRSASASASPTKSPAASPSAVPSGSPTPPPVIDRSVPVVVLNATNRTGLAAEVAKRLRAKGWTVVSVGNWRGGVPTTTVYATGRAAAAATMRYDAKPADATRLTRAGMPKNRIVLVIGPDFPALAGR